MGLESTQIKKDEGIGMVELSLEQAFERAEYHVEKGEMSEAQKFYQAILSAVPDNERALTALTALQEGQSLTNVEDPSQEVVTQLVDLYNSGQLVATVEQAQSLTDQYPKAFIIWNILGAAHKGLGKTLEASEAFKKVTELSPTYADGHNNYGVTLKEQGRLEKAIEAFEKAIFLKPDYAKAHNNMGNALKDQGKLEEAIEAYNTSIVLDPNSAGTYNNLGVALQIQGRFNKAIDSYNEALSINPNYADAYNNMAGALEAHGKLEEAIEAYSKAFAFKNDFAYALSKRLHQQARICDWQSIEEDHSLLPRLGISGYSISPFALLALEDAPERHRLRSENYAKAKFLQKPLPLPGIPSQMPKRLRIGYFSADFKEHPVAYLIAKVLEQHNCGEFEVFGYSLHGSSSGNLHQRIKKSFDCFTDVKDMSDKDVALRARHDKIDIAIDLNGYTQNARAGIFAYRAAPIQINYLGFPGTMGANFIDYIIADQNLIPPSNQKYYFEKQLYLPNTYMPTDNGRKFSKHSILRNNMGLPDSAFVFCCFNNNYKISPKEFDIWMRLLTKVKDSVLWLRKSNQLSDKNIIKEAQKRNIDSSRLVFTDRVSIDDHLSRYKLADLFIDTFAFNAHTTASEALWAGLPVVTKLGKGFAARVAGSLLNAVGLPELITHNENDYEALILELATNPKKLNKIKKKLEVNRLSKPLFNTEQYTKHLENGYLQAYQRHFKGEKPDTIFVKE